LQQTAQFQIANRHRYIGLFVSFKGAFDAAPELLVETIVTAAVLNYELGGTRSDIPLPAGDF
jgi:hypothetical protein